MSERTLARARAGSEDAFRELTDPYRRELQLHCYRILGSVQDAEDLLQETLLAAWRGLDHFEGRASVRAWLYRIATNRCLNALRDGGRRGRDTAAARSTVALEFPEATRRGESIWLEPYPDVLLEGIADRSAEPAARFETAEAIGLAFVTALQHLPPRQRAALVLRDVLGFSAAEAAEMLESSEASVNSALVRARATVEGRLGPRQRDRARLPRSPHERELVGRFARAFESGDVELLSDDAWLTMPPEPFEYQGRDAIATFLRDRRLCVARAHGIIVLTLDGDEISMITRFLDNSVLPHFGLPRTLPA